MTAPILVSKSLRWAHTHGDVLTILVVIAIMSVAVLGLVSTTIETYKKDDAQCVAVYGKRWDHQASDTNKPPVCVNIDTHQRKPVK